MAHEFRAVLNKQLHRLFIGQESMAIANTVFHIEWIFAFIDQYLMKIGLKKSRVAFLKLPHQMIVGQTDIRKNAHRYTAVVNDETVRIARVMKFWKSGNPQIADLNGLIGTER